MNGPAITIEEANNYKRTVNGSLTSLPEIDESIISTLNTQIGTLKEQVNTDEITNQIDFIESAINDLASTIKMYNENLKILKSSQGEYVSYKLNDIYTYKITKDVYFATLNEI